MNIEHNMVTADARAFPLIRETPAEDMPETDTRLERQLDALQPYVDSARIARQFYEKTPSVQNGSRMGEKIDVLRTRITGMLKNIPMSESELWEIVRQKFPNLDWICFGSASDAGRENGND